jgi:AcrR family transcriptional regulator
MKTLIPANRNSDRREAACAAMLDVAISLVGKTGYRGMKLADVGRLSGYSHGLAAFSFGSKDGLARAVAVETDLRYFQYLMDASSKSQTGLGFVENWVNANFDFVKNHPEILRAGIVILVESVTTVPDVRTAYDGLADRNARMIQDAFERGMKDGTVRPDLDAYATALTISGAVAGMNYQWLGNAKLDLKKRRLALLEMVDVLAAARPRYTRIAN